MEVTVNTDKIEFIRRRNFSQVITDALRFIKHNFWPLTQSIMLTTGIPAVGSSLLIGVAFAKNFASIMVDSLNVFGGSSIWDSIWVKIIGVILLFFALALHNAAVSNYMVLYHERGPGNFTASDVAKRSWKSIFTYALAQTMCYLLIALAALFCFLPVIFVIPMVSSVWLAIAYERKNAFDAIARSFTLVKQDWGNILGMLIVLSILILYLEAIIQIPFFIVSTIISIFTLNEDLYANQATQSDLTLSSILNILSFFVVQLWFYIVASVYNVAMGIKYFDLLERKENIAITRDIELIGTPIIKNEEDQY